MDILIKRATIIHRNSEFHLKVKDVLISKGTIKNISDDIDTKNAKIITGEKLFCCIGLIDIGTHTGEPGYEHRETIKTLTSSALAGGYTALAVFPNNKPTIQTKADIRYLTEHPDRQGVSIYPIGVLSKDTSGDDIAEYMDMKSAGAIAFSDGMKSVQDTSLLDRALLYASQAGVSLIHHPDDHFLSAGGEMNEGFMSTTLGMKGIPDIAELHTIQRDILLTEYNDTGIIEHGISSARSVNVIHLAQKNNSKISATVPYLNLIFTDADLHDFDTNLKVIPVLRSPADRLKLVEGIKDGTICTIVSNHTPLDEESKNLEFPYAKPGAIGLETCLSACITYLSDLIDLPVLIHSLTVAPRELLNIHIPDIKVGTKADICIFDTESLWICDKEKIRSKSSNSPFLGKELKGKVLATICG